MNQGLIKRLSPWISLIVSPFLVAPANAFNLVEAWQATYKWNANYAAARAHSEAESEKVVQGRALLLPQVSLSSSHTRTTSMAPAANSYSSQDVVVNVSQPLFDVSKWSAYKKGKLTTLLAEIQFLLTQQQLMAQVIQAYLDVLLAQDTLTATQASKRAYLIQKQQAHFSFNIGAATQIDVNETQASYDNALAKEISDQNNLEVRQQHLSHLTGLDSTHLQPVNHRALIAQDNQRSLEDWLSLAQTHSYSLKEAEHAFTLATQEVAQKKGGHLPVVSLNAAYTAYQQYSPNIAYANPGQHHVSIGISIPIFSGGMIKSEVREALSRKEAADHKWRAARQQVHEAVRKSFSEVMSGTSLITAHQNLVHSAKSKVASTRLGHELGMRSRVELLLAEQSYYDALSSLATAKYQYLNAYVQLVQAAGMLNENWLKEFNSLLQMSEINSKLD